MRLNLNEPCQVILTAYGASVWNTWENQFKRYPGVILNCKDAGDTWKTQLWQLFQVFGDGIHMGMCEVPFEGNNIIIGEDV